MSLVWPTYLLYDKPTQAVPYQDDWLGFILDENHVRQGRPNNLPGQCFGLVSVRLINLQDQQIFESWRGITGNASHNHRDLRRYHFLLPLKDNHM